MSEETVTLRQADQQTIQYVERLLERNDLPSADVASKPKCFYVASDGEETVGIGGLEVYGDAGLLRSVVVEDRARGTGVGTALCTELEARAEAMGVETLYLLTTTAAAFFAELGYERTERTAVPGSIRQTTQFADLCPSTATCMQQSL